ncbi:hypothetical protein B0H16DRAFT_1483370 [Mycena metata]|uniref:Uncharacterized protein n=1 Tax=Mycena metata TaxID=1033252 RepID=A0AAD7GR19_9AGAR|nr:hypothetical protein B0H16DRAFT_1483370 [Mycena metata]
MLKSLLLYTALVAFGAAQVVLGEDCINPTSNGWCGGESIRSCCTLNTVSIIWFNAEYSMSTDSGLQNESQNNCSRAAGSDVVPRAKVEGGKPGRGRKPGKPGRGRKPGKPGRGRKPGKPGRGRKPGKPGRGRKPGRGPKIQALHSGSATARSGRCDPGFTEKCCSSNTDEVHCRAAPESECTLDETHGCCSEFNICLPVDDEPTTSPDGGDSDANNGSITLPDLDDSDVDDGTTTPDGDDSGSDDSDDSSLPDDADINDSADTGDAGGDDPDGDDGDMNDSGDTGGDDGEDTDGGGDTGGDDEDTNDSMDTDGGDDADMNDSADTGDAGGDTGGDADINDSMDTGESDDGGDSDDE